MRAQDIATARLSSQHIARDPFERPEEVVAWMGAMQAQDYHQAVWAIGLRTRSGTLVKVEQAIEDGAILRTWPMRGTIHFVPPQDARWMVALSAARLIAADGRRMAQLELTVEIMGRCQEVFIEALSGGRRLSRPAMMTLLEDAGIRTDQQRGYHILWYLSQSGVICMGPMQAKQQTFVLLDEWAPGARDLPREEALAELARRYFTSHGPATMQDFARWAGLTMGEARLGLEGAKTGLIRDVIEGKDFWLSGDALPPARAEDRAPYLLPGFDEYLLGYKDRGAVLAAEHAQHIIPGKNGVFLPVIVVAGQVVGTWKRALKKKAVDLSLVPFVSLDHVQDQAAEAARAYADFLGLELGELVWGD